MSFPNNSFNNNDPSNNNHPIPSWYSQPSSQSAIQPNPYLYQMMIEQQHLMNTGQQQLPQMYEYPYLMEAKDVHCIYPSISSPYVVNPYAYYVHNPNQIYINNYQNGNIYVNFPNQSLYETMLNNNYLFQLLSNKNNLNTETIDDDLMRNKSAFLVNETKDSKSHSLESNNSK